MSLFDALKSPATNPSSPGYTRAVSPRASLDSDDSALRDLENVLLIDAPASARAKTFPLTPLDFEHDLLQLTAGLNSEGFATVAAAAPQPQSKTLGLLNGSIAYIAFVTHN